jgi:hypothetical protein
MISLILYLASLGAITWFGLKAFDWIHALRYERAKAKRRAVDEAFADGYHAAMGEYGRSKVQAYKVVRATPDRPKPDPFLVEARKEIDALTGPGEATYYPRGS